MSKISQREALALKKRVRELELQIDRQRNAWVMDWVGGVHVATLAHHETALVVHMARKLKHAVVVTTDGDNLRLFALPLGSNARSA